MKKIVMFVFCCFFVVGLSAQNDKFIAKWNVFEMTADGQTLGVEQLKEYGKDKDYLEILPEGKLKMFDDNKVLNGTWEYDKDTKIILFTIFPSDEAKAAGEGKFTDKYTVLEVNKDYLILKAGKIMTTKYKKE